MAELEEAFDRERRRRDDQACQTGKNLQWWECNNSKSNFVGCCTVDPCDGTECPDPPEWQIPEHENTLAPPAIRKTTDEPPETTVMSVGPPVEGTTSLPSTSDDDEDITTTTSARRTSTVHTTITVDPTTTESESPGFPGLHSSTTSGDTSTSDEIAQPTGSASLTTQLDPGATGGFTSSTGDAGAIPLPSSSGGAGTDLPPSEPSNSGFNSLPTSTKMGVYVGVPAAVALIALIFFFFFRRRRQSRRTSSVRDASSPKYDDDKFLPNTMDQPTGSSPPNDGGNAHSDVFAPFGGRVNSVRAPNPLFAHPPALRAELGDSSVQADRISSANTHPNTPLTTLSPTSPDPTRGAKSDAMAELPSEPGSPISPPGTTSSLAKEVTMVRPGSQPRYVEIDSASGSGNSIQAEAPQSEVSATSPSNRPQSHPSQAQTLSTMTSQQHPIMGSRPLSMSVTHPTQLTPGFGGTQMRIQRPVGNAGDIHQQGSTLREQDSGPGREEPELRANLNPTMDEQQKNAHVTAWQKL